MLQFGRRSSLDFGACEIARRRAGGAFTIVIVVLAVVGLIVSYLAWQHGLKSKAARDTAAAQRWASLTVVSVLPEARLTTALRVAILRDSASDRWFNGPAVLDTVTDAWKAALEAVGAEVRVVSPAGLAAIGNPEVLVVPSSPCLGADSRTLVDSALARGRGVITTWLTGTRDALCGDAGYHFLATLTGASRIDTLETRPVTYITFPDGATLAAGLPPGATLQVRGANDGTLRVPARDAYYSDGVLNPAPASGEPMLDAAVAHATAGRGRVVYWGFDLAHVVDRRWDRDVAQLLVRNSVAWAAGQPLVSLAPWPNGRRGAVVLLQEVDGSPDNARRAVDTLRTAGIRGTHFVATSLASDERATVRSLASHGEVASRPDDELRITRTDREQASRFRSMRQHLAELLGRPVRGMMAPMERLDPALAAAWANAGGLYVVAANDARTASPEVLSIDGQQLVLLPRLADDDARLVGDARAARAEDVAEQYGAALEKLRALGGLYLVRYHSGILAGPKLIPALARTARAAAADSALWTATASEVAQWWLVRARTEIATSVTRGGIELRVTNGGSAPLADAMIRIVPGPGQRVTAAQGATLLSPAEGAARVALPSIPAQTTHVIQLRLGGVEQLDAR